LLGILYAALGAFTFALNNVAMRRGVVTGSVLQGMAITVPFGGLTFLVIATAFGELGQLALFPTVAVAWLAGQGIVHWSRPSRWCKSGWSLRWPKGQAAMGGSFAGSASISGGVSSVIPSICM